MTTLAIRQSRPIDRAPAKRDGVALPRRRFAFFDRFRRRRPTLFQKCLAVHIASARDPSGLR